MEHNDRCQNGIDLSLSKGLNGPSGMFDLQIDLRIGQGEFIALAGPSGAGKTTLLRLLAGFDRQVEGRIAVEGKLWLETASRRFLPVRKREIGFVFQDYALFPNMSVLGNVTYALGRRADPAKALRLLEQVRLAGLAAARPAQLSGGQKQRLALIRALARRPKLLLLDEPLSALDPAMRAQLQDEVLRLHQTFGTTTIMVSHDMAEIAKMADRVLRLEAGRIHFDGPPAGAFAATSNGLRARGVLLAPPDATGEALVLLNGEATRLRLPDADALQPGQQIELELQSRAIRPA